MLCDQRFWSKIRVEREITLVDLYEMNKLQYLQE